jgi:hypothetical protein
MNCDDVNKALSQGSRLPLQAQDHVRSCDRCQELAMALNMIGSGDPPSPATLRRITENIAANLRPVRPMAPARYFFRLSFASSCRSSLLVSTAWGHSPSQP